MNPKTATRIERLRSLAGDGNPNEHERKLAAAALERMIKRLADAAPAWAPNWQGEKYQATRGMDMNAITKLIRDEIKMLRKVGKQAAGAAAAEGALKLVEPVGDAPAEIKISIRQPHYGSVNITLSNIPEDWGWRRGDDGYGNERWFATDALEELGRELKALGEAYNYDNGDIMADYFDRRYYLSVEACEPGREYGTSIGYRRP